MKARDYLGATAKAVKAVAVAAIDAVAKPVPSRVLSPDARAEMRRRAEINARGAAGRADMQAALCGRSQWMRPASGWMNRGR